MIVLKEHYITIPKSSLQKPAETACPICDAIHNSQVLTFEGADDFHEFGPGTISSEEFRTEPSKAFYELFESGSLRVEFPDSRTRVTFKLQSDSID